VRLLALAVLVLGFLYVWQGFTLSESMPDDSCPEFAGVEYGWTAEPQWWPPGSVECTATSIEGEVLGSSTFVPWRDYAVVVLFGLAVAVLSPRPLRLLASFALVVAGFAVFFL
jgi:hypothetical protein